MTAPDIFEEMYKRSMAGQPFVLATIIRTAGASPRKVGAKMLVFPDATISGTIGGGNFEKLVIDDCLELFKAEGGHRLKKYNFSKKGEGATGMSCGGEADVYMEVSARPKKLIIIGGGHVGRELARLAVGSDFMTTVIDDRPDILSNYLPQVTTLQTDPDYNDNFPSLGNDCFVVIVTRSHVIDYSVLQRILDEDCAYIGMIGSKGKVAKLFASLEKSGVDRAKLDDVYAPIGLRIKGEGPFEIAVSILAELVAVKNGIVRSSQ